MLLRRICLIPSGNCSPSTVQIHYIFPAKDIEAFSRFVDSHSGRNTMFSRACQAKTCVTDCRHRLEREIVIRNEYLPVAEWCDNRIGERNLGEASIPRVMNPNARLDFVAGIGAGPWPCAGFLGIFLHAGFFENFARVIFTASISY